MTDRYEEIRKALEMGPTPGPWKVDKELGAYSWQWLITLDAGGRGRGIGIAETRAGIGQETANAAHIAACDPDTIRALLDERDALAAEVERLRTDLMESDKIREKLGHLLTRTAAALKGEPPAGVWHSWHDLPEKAAQLAEALAKEKDKKSGDWARALRLADECEESARAWANEIDTRERAAAELRRLHAKQPLTREEIFELAEPFGEFQYGDAQGHKRIDFARAIIAAYEQKNGIGRQE